MTMPSARPVVRREIEREDRVGDRRRRRITVIAIDHRLYAIGREHLQGSRESRLRQSVRVFSDEQRAGDVLAAAVVADRLRDRQDVRLIEGAA